MNGYLQALVNQHLQHSPSNFNKKLVETIKLKEWKKRQLKAEHTGQHQAYSR